MLYGTLGVAFPSIAAGCCIGHTTTKTGLQVRAALDTQSYPTGRKITDEEFAQIQIERIAFHGGWNYKILPKESG